MADMQPMVSMALDDETREKMIQPIAMPDKPDFPYGLRISLTSAELDKLDIDPSEAFRGAMFHMHAICRITNVNANDGENGPSCCIEAQIEDMCIESEDGENADDEAAEDAGTRRSKLYDGM